MNKIVYFTIYVAVWITVASMFVSALQYSVKQMEGTTVALRESRSRTTETRTFTLQPTGGESEKFD